MYVHDCSELTVEITLPRAIELKAWGIRSANDFEERNPAAFDVYFKASSEESDWTLCKQIKKGENSIFQGPWHRRAFNFEPVQ